MSEVTQTKIFHYFTELLDQFTRGFLHLIQNKNGIDLQGGFLISFNLNNAFQYLFRLC